jgi:yeast amino acid transporter
MGPKLTFQFIIIGIMMYFVMQALAELSVIYPVNGAFFAYAYRVSLESTLLQLH